MKKLRILLLMFVLLFCLQDASAPGARCSAASSSTKSGLVKSKGKYYYYKNGKKVKNTWKTIKVNGKKYKYYFGSNGAAYAGKTVAGEVVPAVKTIGKYKYAFDAKGRMLTGIQVIGEKFYYFKSNGRLNSTRTTKLRKASKYEKNVTTLRKLLKKYGYKLKNTEYYGFSCYGDGEDGSLIYSNFEVQVFKYNSSGKVIVLGVYPR